MSTESGEVLMEEGSWKIMVAKGHFIQQYGLNSYIVHNCPEHDIGQLPYLQYWWQKDTLDPACYLCDQHPPDHIMALWKLHNFDYIQGGYQ